MAKARDPLVQLGNGGAEGGGVYRKPAGRTAHAGEISIVAGRSGKTGPSSFGHPAMVVLSSELESVVFDFDGTRMDVAFINHRGQERDSFAWRRERSRWITGVSLDQPLIASTAAVRRVECAVMHRMKTALGRLRLIGWWEGLSFLVLILVAMPLKYLAGEPGAVRWVGMAHGVLFLLYVLAAIQAAVAYRWSWKRTALVLVASLLPAGPFVLDAKLLRHEAARA